MTWGLLPGIEHVACESRFSEDQSRVASTCVSRGKGSDDVINLRNMVECLSRILQCERQALATLVLSRRKKIQIWFVAAFSVPLGPGAYSELTSCPQMWVYTSQQGTCKKTHSSPREFSGISDCTDDHSSVPVLVRDVFLKLSQLTGGWESLQHSLPCWFWAGEGTHCSNPDPAV